MTHGLSQTRSSVRIAALATLVFAIGAIALVLILNRRTDDAPLLIAALSAAVVGYLILVRADGNRVGWVLLAMSIFLAGAGIAVWFTDNANAAGGAIGGTMWFSMILSLGFLLYWFPTGQPLSPRWRWAGWMGGVAGAAAISYTFAEELCVEGGDTCEVWIANPIGIRGVPNPEYGALSDVFLVFAAGFLAASLASLIVRYIRARGVERLQMKWLAVAGVALVGSLVISEMLPVAEVAADLMFNLGVMGLPLAVGAAVMRYRLYEIDRIISRTVSYALIVGFLGLVLFGLVAGLGAWLGSENQLVVAVSTLAVAGLFNPVRRRVQGWVDRRFNRSRYDAERVMSEFGLSLRDRVDPDGVVDGWVGVVSETMQPESVGVWVRE
jgi:hypothetical protein